MKLVRFGAAGIEKPGILLEDGQVADVSDSIDDYNEAFFEQRGLSRLQTLVEARDYVLVDDNERLGPPIVRPSKLICVGLNL